MRIEMRNGQPCLHYENLGTRTATVRDALKNLSIELRGLQVCFFILSEIATDWQRPFAEKRPAYFFLEKDTRRRAVVIELLPTGTRIFSENERAEWQQDPDNNPNSKKRYQAVPPHLPAIHFDEIATGICEKCRKHHPLIQEVTLLEEKNDYEIVQEINMVVCVPCGNVSERTTSKNKIKL